MAGIEQLEIHSKSYIVRWVKVDEGHTISWSVQPHKKSINFAIVKHPGTGGTTLAAQADDTSALENSTEGAAADNKPAGGLFAKKDASTAQDQLARKGFIPIKWHGKCEADKVSVGTYDVTSGGMFGLVFDNTFSKQTAKTATFVLLTYPTGAPPQTARHLPNLQAGPNASSSRTSLNKYSSPRLAAAPSDSVDSLHSHPPTGRPHAKSDVSVSNSQQHTGTLYKRRRKKGQGHARRFFSLDYTTCTLSYYHNRNSSALRGAIPLSLAAVAADERRREITIDSGAEVWHLRASNPKEFKDWASAIERASRIARGLEVLASNNAAQVARPPQLSVAVAPNNPQEDREWAQVETLVSRIVGTRDALRRLVKDMAAQKHASNSHASLLAPGTPTLPEEPDGYFAQPEKRSFWKRKASSSSPLTPTQAMQTALASTLAVPTPTSVASASSNGARRGYGALQEERNTYENCAALLRDLDSVVVEFSTLLNSSKRRRLPAPTSAAPRHSYDSTSTEEFFDAEAGESAAASQSQLVIINHQSEEDTVESDEDLHETSSVSSVEDDEEFSHTAGGAAGLFPAKPKSLTPLPIKDAIQRRKTIPPSKVSPPSLIGLVRKNVGKDLSTISMPVSTNEPTSLLQRVAEQLEYADLLDKAAQQTRAEDRLLYVTAFAISQFSGGRAKERAIRKPFNPLLGETFELVRTDAEVPGGFRLLVEKVTHRPVRLAMQADSAMWSFSQSPAPSQKFWGKSAEITTEGRVRVALRRPDGGDDELYSWTIATVFLRNVVMGEKYVEPVGTMHVANESTGAKAAVEFRSKGGVFGGRGEDVYAELFGEGGAPAGVTLVGTWTQALRAMPGNREVWKAGALVENAASTYGMPVFAAGLNEITALERGKLPPTDSRLRPDQRLAEEGDLDRAEEWKVKLEEAQRDRRRQMEEAGEEHRPRWFVKVEGSGGEAGGEEVWKLKGGKEGYWEERTRGGWGGVVDIFSG